MKGDYSKLKSPVQIKGDHNYNVLIQQGRVNLDSDWNEQSQINTYRSEAAYADIIGESGAPLINAGFKIEPVIISPLASPLEGDLSISKGHYYVDGILCENNFENLTFESQPDLPYASLPTIEGNYLFYLDVWLRHITANEDSTLREVALGGPDTATRTKVVWQVKWSPITAFNCDDASLPPETNLSTGALSAKSEVVKDSGDPCGITSSGGYRGLQNQLYRVEIHTPGTDRTQATFKWSRDNGSVLVKCSGQDINDKNNLIVASTGRDDLLGFKSGNWIEIINDDNDLLNTPGILAQLLPSTGNILTIDPASIKDPNSSGANSVIIDSTKNTRIRRWDSEAAIQLNTDDTWKPLEDGVEVNFNEGTFKTGDYWLIPARTAIAIKDVVWPFIDAQLPQGNTHHYAKLAVASYDLANGWSILSDCRNLFPSLTEQTGLYYVGGDGQEAAPGSKLPEPLKVGVANGSLAVGGAKVKFVITSGDGTLDTPEDGITITDDNGIATCNLTLGSDTSKGLQVEANLVDDDRYIIEQKLPVVFSPGFVSVNNSACCEITIGTNGTYKTLNEAISNTLAQLKEADKDLNASLCLLPEEHNIDEDIDMSEMGFQILHITGKAAHITMNTNSIKLFADKKIILEGFSLGTPADRNQVTDPQSIVITTNQLTVDHCSFTRNGAQVDVQGNPSDGGISGQANTPFFYVNNNNTTVYLSNNVFLGFFSLVLANGVQGSIEKNVITLLLLQSVAIDQFIFNPVNFNIEDQTNVATITQAMEVVSNWTIWSLSIKGNYVGGIITNFNVGLYLSIIISENIFNLPAGIVIANSFIAQNLTIVNNQFLYIPPASTGPLEFIPPLLIAFVAGLNIIITSNMGRSSRMTIDVVNVFPILGMDPPLNLLNIRTPD